MIEPRGSAERHMHRAARLWDICEEWCRCACDKHRKPLSLARVSCYTEFVPRNITIKISEEVALWARRRAAEENTSVSRLVGQMLERQMRLSDEYWRAFEEWKSNRPKAEISAKERMNREEAHERR